MLLQGKKAIVTGGTRGIGYSIAETFLRNGASVAIFGSRQETVDKALAQLKEENPECHWHVAGSDGLCCDGRCIYRGGEGIRTD